MLSTEDSKSSGLFIAQNSINSTENTQKYHLPTAFYQKYQNHKHLRITNPQCELPTADSKSTLTPIVKQKIAKYQTLLQKTTYTKCYLLETDQTYQSFPRYNTLYKILHGMQCIVGSTIFYMGCNVLWEVHNIFSYHFHYYSLTWECGNCKRTAQLPRQVLSPWHSILTNYALA